MLNFSIKHPVFFLICSHMHNTHTRKVSKQVFRIASATPPGNDITLGVYLRFLSCRLVEPILPSIVSTLLSRESRETSWSSISACSPRPRFFRRPRPRDISSAAHKHTVRPAVTRWDPSRVREKAVFLTEVTVQLLMGGPQLFVLGIPVLIGRPVIQRSRRSESCPNQHQ